jgi:hypothetical protein
MTGRGAAPLARFAAQPLVAVEPDAAIAGLVTDLAFVQILHATRALAVISRPALVVIVPAVRVAGILVRVAIKPAAELLMRLVALPARVLHANRQVRIEARAIQHHPVALGVANPGKIRADRRLATRALAL